MPPLEVRCLVNGPFVENTWVAFCPRTREGVVVDPGFEPEGVLSLLRKERVKVLGILATHGHIDHVWGAAALREATGAPFRMHPADGYWLEALERQAAMFGLEPPSALPVVDRPLAEGERIRFGDALLETLHTPGHSPGGVCFHDGAGTLFSGDLLFQGSIGRTDFPGGDFPTIVRSIRGRIFALPGGTVVHSGHGPDTTVGEEKAGNPFVGDGAELLDAPGDLPYG
ncbi:MAG: MBL fold metallo-hydrolase [Planctomycetaceae bacterium]|nr:MBL fold metallo-hydrolase [Planctomycetota bacterium]NUN51946.1 MBL fold metallo-hydrolase [Planctomycetaceae bacterium]